MRISDGSSDVCSSDLVLEERQAGGDQGLVVGRARRAVRRRGGHFHAPRRDRRLAGVGLAEHAHRVGAVAVAVAQVEARVEYQRARDRPVLRELVVELVELHGRSEEHTSELQSLMRISYAVFCLKKKTRNMTK